MDAVCTLYLYSSKTIPLIFGYNLCECTQFFKIPFHIPMKTLQAYL